MSFEEIAGQVRGRELPQASSTFSGPSYERDADYYLDVFTLLVDGTLFQVPKHRFVEGSEVFKDMLSLPQTPNSVIIEGSTDSKPIKLEGVSKADFKALLHVLYPKPTQTTIAELSIEQWLSALRLSDMWSFGDCRHIAIEQLSKMSIKPSEKILLGRRHKIRRWLLQGYYELIQAEEPITLDIAQEIGYETAFQLIRIRERNAYDRGLKTGMRRRKSGLSEPQPNGQSLPLAGLEQVFATELQEMGEEKGV